MGNREENREINYNKILETGTESAYNSIRNAPEAYAMNRREKMYSRYVPNKRLSRYQNAFKSLLPFRKTSKEVLSVEYAGIFSQITFFWMWKYIFVPKTSNQNEETVPTCPSSDGCMKNAPRLDGKWSEIAVKQGNNSGSMTYVAWLFIRTRIIIATLMYFIGITLSIGGLLEFLDKILSAVHEYEPINNTNNPNSTNNNDSDAPTININRYEIITYISLLGFIQIVSCFFYSWSNYINLRTAIRLRTACLSNIYRRAMTTSIFYDIAVNQIASFMVPNGKHVEEMVLCLPQLIASPFVLLFCFVLCSIYFNPWILINLGSLILLFIIFYLLIECYSEYKHNKTILSSNQRFELMEELVSNIVNIKIFLFDGIFKNDINKIRNQEVELIKSSQRIESFCTTIIEIVPIFMIISLFISYNAEETTDSIKLLTVFPIILIHIKQALENFYTGIIAFSKGTIALKMLKGIMSLENVSVHIFKPSNTNLAISITDGDFMYASNQNKGITMNVKKGASLKRSKPQLLCLKEIDCEIHKGSVIGICGQSGSGKTSFLYAILGHLKETKKGTNRSLKSDGQFAYIGEDPFIADGTVKDNITFGHGIDTNSYRKALSSAGLLEELDSLPDNDSTIISKSTISLSFSQRIDLARAIYANKDIYLLDRFLNGVDSQLAEKIFENSILNCLNGKTVIIVTDKSSFLAKCDNVFMMYNGTITEMGTHDDLMNKSDNYAQFMAICNERNSKIGTIDDRLGSLRGVKDETVSTRNRSLASVSSISYDNILLRSSDPLASAETIVYTIQDTESEVTSSGKYYKIYFNAFGIFGQVLYGILNLLLALIIMLIPLFLIMNLKGKFQDSAANIFENFNIIFLGEIAILFLFVLTIGFVNNFYYAKKIYQPAVDLHKEWIDKLCNASIHYFQATKLSTVLSTIFFSLHITDLEMPKLIRRCVFFAFAPIAALTLIAYTAYEVALPMILLSTLYFFCMGIVTYAYLRYNWNEVHSRNDIFNQIISTIGGRATIQAYNKQNEFTNDFYEKCEHNLVHIFLLHGIKYLMSFLVNIISVLILLVAIGCYVFIIERDKEEKLSDISLIVAITFLYCNLMVSFSECISEIVGSFATLSSTENMQDNIDNEDIDTKNYININETWPEINKANIVFRSVSASLMNDNFCEINELSFSAASGQTMGIFGLSNSGRQAFTAAMFRLISLNKGKIIVGDHDIVQVPLKKLRSVISYVPHEPTLFNNSIKSFLDPTGVLKESDIIDALKKVELYTAVSLLPDGLQSFPNENLTMGEKQLLCLAKAYLEQAKIILLQQNASNIGTVTTKSLETALKSLFKHSTTIILAEHLHSLVNCDSVIIIENGQVVEKGSPKKLYLNTKSRFSIVMNNYKETSM